MNFSVSDRHLSNFDKDYIIIHSRLLLGIASDNDIDGLKKLARYGHAESIALLLQIEGKEALDETIKAHLHDFLMLDIQGLATCEQLYALGCKTFNEDMGKMNDIACKLNKLGGNNNNEFDKLIKEYNDVNYVRYALQVLNTLKGELNVHANILKKEYVYEISNTLNFVNMNIGEVFENRDAILRVIKGIYPNSTYAKYAFARNVMIFGGSRKENSVANKFLELCASNAYITKELKKEEVNE